MNIDNAAHLGGLATGFVCGLLLSQKLAPQAADWRPLRNAVTGVVGLGAVVLGFWLLPPAPPDVHGELMRFSDVERQVNSIYSDAAQKYDDQKITPAEMVHTLEHDVLPPWEESLQRLERLENMKDSLHDMVSEALAYARLRRESWQALIVALRDHDQEAMQRFKARWEAANKLLEEKSDGH